MVAHCEVGGDENAKVGLLDDRLIHRGQPARDHKLCLHFTCLGLAHHSAHLQVVARLGLELEEVTVSVRLYHNILFLCVLVDNDFKGIGLLGRRWIDKTGDYEVEFIASLRQGVPGVDHHDPVEAHTDLASGHLAQLAHVRANLHGRLIR